MESCFTLVYIAITNNEKEKRNSKSEILTKNFPCEVIKPVE